MVAHITCRMPDSFDASRDIEIIRVQNEFGKYETRYKFITFNCYTTNLECVEILWRFRITVNALLCIYYMFYVMYCINALPKRMVSKQK